MGISSALSWIDILHFFKLAHWCPVNGVLFFSIMLFFIDKSGKTSVTDMNFLERKMLYCADDIRALYSLPNYRFDSSRNTDSLGIPLSGRVARATFWSASAVDLYGLRSTDLARWSARYRRMPQCQARGPLPSGFSGTRCQIHFGRCQRKAGLEALGGVGFELDSQSQKSLRERGLGAGFGKHRLRAGLDDDRFVADDVSLGDIPHDQERDQGSHPDRFERTDSSMRVRVSSQHARCEVAGHVGLRGWRDLHFRQGLYRLCQTSLHRGLGGVFRNTRQGQPAFCSARISSCGQNDGPAKRSGGVFGASQGQRKLPLALAANPVFRCRAETLFGVLDQPHGAYGFDGCQTLQEALGHRVVFQMDQRQSADQALLWNEPQCGENADLDRRNDLSAGSHPAQGAETARKPAQNSSDFERSPVREDCFA